MSSFVVGQRLISNAELQLGLGSVVAVEHRTVTVAFTATEETRMYARDTAPLTRVRFTEGDSIEDTHGNTLLIEQVFEDQGLLTYVGSNADGQRGVLPEGMLDHNLQLSRPSDRLFSGQVDKNRWFELRYHTLQHRNRLLHSDLYGLIGGRTAQIPHQLYIAHEVARRFAPRVLLADEVGLGKTIEAGMILHQQLLTERARRVLIVVPESLVHQWLIEMLRRFNLHFSVLDAGRCEAIEESSGQDNPFLSTQLVICTLGFLSDNEARLQQALAADWDLLVVDEAHHLEWSEEQVSPQYRCIEQLATHTPGVLLLSATPEQLGLQGHFARLRLLDPDRFADFQQFEEEEKDYEPVARAISALLQDEMVNSDELKSLLHLEEEDNHHLLEQLQSPDSQGEPREQARLALMEHLLDRHGTGRVLFRNTRAAVGGFPERQLLAHALPLPEAYRQCLQSFDVNELENPQLLLCPELLYQAVNDEPLAAAWTDVDSRVPWLLQQLKERRGEKQLIICASADTALDLAEVVRIKSGIHAAVFHEGMSLLERDRAAAYFADLEFGSPLLICSEIGSEGRNFQFAHHLVLFDLPHNPDLLEQRIGRLDRIGQSQTIRLHVPYLQESAQEVMFRWYHEGLQAFVHTCPAGHQVFVEQYPQLLKAMQQAGQDAAALEALQQGSAARIQALNEAMHRGRDRLLEFNSCRPHLAHSLCEQAAEVDEDAALDDYLELLFDSYGIESEEHMQGSQIIRPGSHMQGQHFPELTEDGLTITTQRAIALANDDIQFISWEHPLVGRAMDMVLSGEQGNATVSAVRYPACKAGTMLLECLYVLESSSSREVGSARYLPPTTVRIVVDELGEDHSKSLDIAHIRQHFQAVPESTAQEIIRRYTDKVRDMLGRCDEKAGTQAPVFMDEARARARISLQSEAERLQALQGSNPNVRNEEIEYFQKLWQQVDETLSKARPRLDAMRVLVTVP